MKKIHNFFFMERTFNSEEVKEMCSQSYMRGMMIQYEGQSNTKKLKPRKVFNEWVKDLINECPFIKVK